jgi:hypothetical protein
MTSSVEKIATERSMKRLPVGRAALFAAGDRLTRTLAASTP